MTWEVRTEIPPDRVEELESLLCEWVRSPWSILQENPSSAVLLSGYFDDRTEGVTSWNELRAVAAFLPSNPTWQELEDSDWQNAYKAFLTPWQCGRLHWVPLFDRDTYPVPVGDKALYLDAGMAFGTGAHETTRLCAVRMLEHTEKAGAEISRLSVIDAGCGSGILTLSAALLGYGKVHGFDWDPEAIRVSLENQDINHLSSAAVRFEEAGLEDGLANKRADLLLANIQTEVLRLYPEELIASLNPGGTLVLSGILEREHQPLHHQFLDTFARQSIQVIPRIDVLGDWVSLQYQLSDPK